jgi:hypothetical protein
VPQIRIEATPSPGLVDLVEASDLGDSVDVAAKLDNYLATPHIANSSIDTELRTTVLGPTGTKPVMVAPDYGDRLKDFFHPSQEKVVGRQETQIAVHVYQISLPARAGAKATLTISRDAAVEVSATFKILGIGGGKDWKVDLKEQITRDTAANEVVVVSVPAIFEVIERTHEGVTLRYPRLTTIRSGERDLDFEPMEAVTWQPEWQAVETHESDQRHGSGGVTTMKLEMERGTNWELSPQVKLDQFGLEFGAKITGTYSSDVSLACALPDGALYIARLAPTSPVFVWETVAADHA